MPEPGATAHPKPVALVTGSARGIGRAIALRLAADGFDIVVNYPNPDDGPEETMAALAATDAEAIAVQADVAVVPEIDAMFDRIQRSFGRLDVLVNNAAAGTFETFFEISEETWDRTHAVCLRGAFFCSQRAARMMLDGGRGGRIVSIASISAHVGGTLEISYCPTKSGLISLMQSLCLVLGEHGITCNSVSPGVVATDGVAELMSLEPGLQERYEARIPLGRFADPAEVASAVSYLSSPEARYVNGAEILVDGGVLANPE